MIAHDGPLSLSEAAVPHPVRRLFASSDIPITQAQRKSQRPLSAAVDLKGKV